MSIYVPRSQSYLAEFVGDLIADTWRDSQVQRTWLKFDGLMVDSRPDRVVRRYLKRQIDTREAWPHRRPGL